PRAGARGGGAPGRGAGARGGGVPPGPPPAAPPRAAAAPRLTAPPPAPPVLAVVRGEPIRLRYGLVCAPRDDGGPCDGSGTVYLRAGHTGPFQPYPLQRGGESKDGRYFLEVPAAIGGSPDGFSYYAVLRDDATGATVSLPSRAADAPPLRPPLPPPLPLHLAL